MKGINLESPITKGVQFSNGVTFISLLWSDHKWELEQLTSEDLSKIWTVVQKYNPHYIKEQKEIQEKDSIKSKFKFGS